MTEQEAMDAAYRASPITPKSMWHHWQIAWQAALQWAADGQEPVAWVQPDHLAKATTAPFLCRVEPQQRDDFVPLYAAPVPNADLLAEVERLRKALEQTTDALASRLGTNADEWSIVQEARAALAKGGLMACQSELVDKAKYELHVFERVSADTSSELIDEIDRLCSVALHESECVAAANEEIDRLRAEVAALRAIESTARNLVAVKGRHHSEIAYQRLVEVMKDGGERR